MNSAMSVGTLPTSYYVSWLSSRQDLLRNEAAVVFKLAREGACSANRLVSGIRQIADVNTFREDCRLFVVFLLA